MVNQGKSQKEKDEAEAKRLKAEKEGKPVEEEKVEPLEFDYEANPDNAVSAIEGLKKAIEAEQGKLPDSFDEYLVWRAKVGRYVRLLMHYVQDLHQPLHAFAYRLPGGGASTDDNGGLQVKNNNGVELLKKTVEIGPQKTKILFGTPDFLSLHDLWDKGLGICDKYLLVIYTDPSKYDIDLFAE